ELAQKYKDLEIDLVSAKDNPNCSCRGKVWEYFINKFNTEKEETNNFLKNLYEKYTSIKVRIDAFEYNINFIKTIHIIDNTQEAWNNFQNKLSSIDYKSVSIIEKKDKFKILLT
ncbi:hypothetical protein EB061_11475, partial [bacterium]|nr:hypothetical protein [bacterium]